MQSIEIKDEKKNGIFSLHLLKVICSICVVIVHLPPLWLRLPILPLCRTAVPCFLLISGYFLVENHELSLKRIKHSAVKILKLILISNFAYLCFNSILQYITCGEWIIDKWLTFDFWFENIIVGKGFSGPLWYLNAYLEGLLVLLLITKYAKNLVKSLTSIAPLMLLLSIYSGAYKFIWGMPQGFFIWQLFIVFGLSLPLLLIGAKIRNMQTSDFSYKSLLVFFCISMLCAYVEFLWFKHSGRHGATYLLCTFPCSMSLFLLCLKLNNKNIFNARINSFIVFFSKSCSLILYIYHMMVYKALLVICEQLAIDDRLVANSFIVSLVIMSYCFIRYRITCYRKCA